MSDRPTWDEWALDLVNDATARADCSRSKVAALLMLSDHSVVKIGYNGSPPGGPSCLKGECPRGRLSYEQLAADSPYDTGGGECIALHAEMNVLLRASWQEMEGSTLYVTREPCHICWSLIKGTGIVRVVWREDGDIREWKKVIV